ncbi:MAG: hypothetical protein PHS14_08550 [Elusimicrobia bacterium]|nr:hypothetical protein [Elusimicrobiota bacterium]
MNIRLMRLELRKNGLAAASAAAAFLITLPVCRLVSAATGLELRLSLDAALTAWILLGVPLAAALIGAASGAASASRDALDAEALLPPSPGRRAASSIAVSVLLAAAFAAFVLATGAVLGMPPGRVLAPGQKAWGASFWYGLQLAPLVALAALDVLAGAWALSRLLGHGVAGGLLALAATTAAGAGLAVCFGLEIEHYNWGAACLRPALAIAYGGALAKVWAGVLAARWSERRTGARTLACALALLILPAFMIWGRAGAELSMLDARVVPAGHEAVYRYQSIDDRFPRGGRALAAAGEGAVLKTVRGGIVIADARGVRPLVPEQNTGLSELLLEPYKTWIHGAWRDEKGVLWIERYVSPNTELWRIEGAKAASRRMTDGGSLGMIAGVPLKHRYPDSKRLLLASVDDYFLHGEKASWYEGYIGYLPRRRREAAAARPACAGRCLEVNGRRWKLPGAALSADIIYPDEIGGLRAYLVPVRTAKGEEVALCRADGTTDIAWPFRPEPGGRLIYRGLPDGTLFAFGERATLRAIAPDGRIVAPIPYSQLAAELPKRRSAQPELVRRAEGKVWLVWGGKLTVLDAGGKTVSSRPLPAGIEETVPLKDGFLITTKRSAYFSDWNGALRRVENPR